MGIRHLAALLCLSMVASCSGGDGGGGGGGPVSFEVTAILPGQGSEDVALTAEVKVFFSKPVDPDSVDSDSIKVVVESGDVIPGTRIVPLLNNQQIRFVPTLEYFPFAVHRVELTTGVRDTDGNALDKSYTFEFQTVEKGPVLPGPSQLENLGNVLNNGRWFHRMTLLPSNRFLVAGGYVFDGSVTDIAENLVAGQKASFDIADRMQQPRAAHVQLLLPNGRVLLAGGEMDDNPFTPLASCEVYDPATQTFSLVASMNFARSFAHGILLPEGRVLVTGGQSLDGSTFIFRDDAEIYDPVADTWTPVANKMEIARSGHFSAVATDGNAVILGGRSGVISGELWNATTRLFEPAQTLPSAPHFFGAGTTLPDGRPIVVGGFGSRSVTLYTVAFGFLNGLNQMAEERQFATATAFADGRVLIVGGADLTSNPAILRDTADIVYQVGQTVKVFRIPDFPLPAPTSHHDAALGPQGNVWVTGGLPTNLQLPGLRQVFLVHPE